MNSAPSSTGTPRPEPLCVQMRPPMRARASSTVTDSPAAARRAAAMSPAAPAPSTTTSQSGRRSRSKLTPSRRAMPAHRAGSAGNYALFGGDRRKEGLQRARAVELRALGEIEADGGEPASGSLRIHLLGAAVNAQHFGRLRNRDDPRLRKLVAHRLDGQLRIDLHHTQGFRAQELEGSRMKLEVIEYDEATELLALCDQALGLRQVADAGRLVQLEADGLRGNAALFESRG